MKNFESEYREMIRKDMPDLWERIEAGLPDKNRKNVNAAEMVRTAEAEKKEERKEKFRTRKLLKYTGMIAACLCGIIVIPTALMLLSGGAKGRMESAGESMATEDTMEELETDNSGIFTEGTQADLNKEIPMADRMESGAEAAESTVIENIEVRILEITEMKYHTIYLAAVEKDESGTFRAEEEVEFIAEGTLRDALQEGDSCRVTLTYDARSEIAYHLTAVTLEKSN